MRRNSFYDAFYSQRYTAGLRGIDFLLTFEEWLQIWIDSGHLHERGRGKGKYCMARFGDKGPYAVGNVKIILHEVNVSEGGKGIAKPEIHGKRISEALKGVPKSEAHKRSMSICRIGKTQSPETRKKRSIAMKGWPSHRKGKVIGPQSDEHVRKRMVSKAYTLLIKKTNGQASA